MILECGGKRSATPLGIIENQKRRRRLTLPADSSADLSRFVSP